MVGSIKAIETEYAGVRFRSRLEARWAVFFDALGLKWEFEPEAFRLEEGDGYLPDFYLPDFHTRSGVFVEVKPELERVSYDKALRFAAQANCQVWACVGIPDFKVTHLFNGDNINLEQVASYHPPSRPSPCSDLDELFYCETVNKMWRLVEVYYEAGPAEVLWREATPVIPLADQAQDENRFFESPGYEDQNGYFSREHAGELYESAVAAVKRHRFWR